MLGRVSPKVLKRVLTGLALALAIGGVGLLVYPFATDLWAARLQRGLAAELGDTDTYLGGRVKDGEPLTRLEIPSLDLDVIVVEGVTPSALRAGAGHYPETPLPGQRGNVAIAGHRTTFGRPFNRIEELRPRDEVVLTTPVGRYVYEILGAPVVVAPDDWSVIDDHPKTGAFLTLTSCHPEGSATQRIVVHAELVEQEVART